MEKLRVIIAGGRELTDYNLVRKTCDYILRDTKKNNEPLVDVEIISGTARGADLLGERYANEKGFSISSYPANWDLHGKSAGYIRNKEMAEYAHVLIAFWDGKSKGTEHMINLAIKSKLIVRVQNY